MRMKTPRVTLEQWHVLQTVIDEGGYAQAAAKLHRSQSSVSYTIGKLEEQLGVSVLTIEGRKAQLTPVGETLLLRSRHLVREAAVLEEFAHQLDSGWEPEIRLVVDAACPVAFLMQVLRSFEPLCNGTRVRLLEVVLSGAEDALKAGEVDLAITPLVPRGYLGEQILEIEFVAVAADEHDLFLLEKELTVDDIHPYRQVVIRDSGVQRQVDAGWLGAEYRWTVSSMDTATAIVVNGLAFGWLPRDRVQEYLDQGKLKILPLREGGVIRASLNLVYGNQSKVGPATRQLADLFIRHGQHVRKDQPPNR